MSSDAPLFQSTMGAPVKGCRWPVTHGLKRSLNVCTSNGLHTVHTVDHATMVKSAKMADVTALFNISPSQHNS